MQDYTVPPKRPTSATVIAIIAIALGSLSTCCGLYTGFSLVMSDRLQAVSQQMSRVGRHADDPQIRQQREMQAEMLTFQKGWAPFTGSFVVIQLFVSLLSIVGGALAVSGKGVGRAMLLGTFVFGTLFELVRGAVETFMQLQLTEVMQRYMTRMMASMPHAGAQPELAQTMGTVMGGASVAGIVVALLWALVKIAYYVAGLIALRREDVRRYYS